MLEITVHEIRGGCPVHEEGDRIMIDDPEVDLDESDALCTHAMSTLLHYTTVLERGSEDPSLPIELGLSKEEGVAYMQCVDPGEPYTDGGTVIFRCEKVED